MDYILVVSWGYFMGFHGIIFGIISGISHENMRPHIATRFFMSSTRRGETLSPVMVGPGPIEIDDLPREKNEDNDEFPSIFFRALSRVCRCQDKKGMIYPDFFGMMRSSKSLVSP